VDLSRRASIFEKQTEKASPYADASGRLERMNFFAKSKCAFPVYAPKNAKKFK
jgi:hypothetical protein